MNRAGSIIKPGIRQENKSRSSYWNMDSAILKMISGWCLKKEYKWRKMYIYVLWIKNEVMLKVLEGLRESIIVWHNLNNMIHAVLIAKTEL